MNQTYEKKHHNLEEDYCWFKARRDIIINLLEKYPKNSKILDIGCSSGILIKSLNKRDFYNIYGIDISEEAIKICENKKIKNISLMKGEKLDFKNEEFDIIIASDVLEHIKDEKGAIKEWRRVLKEGGVLIIFAPAFNFLWSAHDEQNHHYRRYSKTELKKSLKEAGFFTERLSYWNFSLFLPTFLIRITQKIFKKKQESDQLLSLNPLIDFLIFKILKLENLVLKKINLPIGVSVFSIAKK